MPGNDDCECNRNYEIIGSTVFGAFVILSEAMPFVKHVKANGIIHAMYQFYQSYTAKKQSGDLEAPMPELNSETIPIATATEYNREAEPSHAAESCSVKVDIAEHDSVKNDLVASVDSVK